MTPAQKTAEKRVNNQDTPVNKSKEDSDSVINFDAIGKLDKHTFRIEQESDRSLDPLRSNESYYIKEGLLYRHVKKNNSTDQPVVPGSLHELVLKGCHAIPIAGHMGIGATKKRICSRSTWPGVMQDTIRFVKSCITCQADIVDRPFVNLLYCRPTHKQQVPIYILTLVDTATRWPEAVPLRDIRTTDVTSALFNIFSRLGLLKQIFSDNGQQLVSKCVSKVIEMMGI